MRQVPLRVLWRPKPRSPRRLQAVPLSILRDFAPVNTPCRPRAELLQVDEQRFILLPLSGFLIRVSWMLTISQHATPAGWATRADAAKSEGGEDRLLGPNIMLFSN